MDTDAIVPLNAEAMRQIVLNEVRKYGDSGVTVVDFCADTGMRVQTVSARMAELEKLGQVKTVGRRVSHATNTSGKVRAAA
jgi:hypothetical protein